MRDWQDIDKELQAEFESGEILKATREDLDRWLVALTGKSYEYMKEQTPLLQRLAVVTHLAKVRLDEESLRRRDEQAARASESSRRQYTWTLLIAVASVVLTLVLAIADRVWPPSNSLAPPAPVQPTVAEPVTLQPAVQTPSLPAEPAPASLPPPASQTTAPKEPVR